MSELSKNYLVNICNIFISEINQNDLYKIFLKFISIYYELLYNAYSIFNQKEKMYYLQELLKLLQFDIITCIDTNDDCFLTLYTKFEKIVDLPKIYSFVMLIFNKLNIPKFTSDINLNIFDNKQINQEKKEDCIKSYNIPKQSILDKNRICFNFRDTGTCRFGDKCFRSHDIIKPAILQKDKKKIIKQEFKYKKISIHNSSKCENILKKDLQDIAEFMHLSKYHTVSELEDLILNNLDGNTIREKAEKLNISLKNNFVSNIIIKNFIFKQLLSMSSYDKTNNSDFDSKSGSDDSD